MELPGFDPLISEWFARRFENVTEPQRLGWPEIRSGRDVLISAPTGSGKTLAAFLNCLDTLVAAARAGPLENRIEAVYVSPLKALSNDIRKNLEIPLGEIRELAGERGVSLAGIHTAVRTGDTPAWERHQMMKEPPHILVTTPESLYILLTTEKGRKALATTRTVIVDEIHAVADDKRGSHLALSLERLDALVAEAGGAKPQRIGLSATVKPVEEVASFLSTGAAIVQIGHRRAMKLSVEVPQEELGAVATNEMWAGIYDRLVALIREHRTTLVFVNTRRLAERVTHQLKERLGEQVVVPHHGSLSRRLRHDAEQRLKSGELRAVVATASLELGIDVGTVDLVCQIGSPRSIAVGLQRVGRSGHWVGAMPEGRLFATTRDELIEMAALVGAIRHGELDRIEIPENPLDVLAQQIVAEVAGRSWGEDELFEMVRRAYPYRNLPRTDFDEIVEMLSEGISTSRGRSGAFLHRDRINGRVRGRRGARLAAITCGGAIPDNANYQVVADPEGTVVGTVDEDFAVESMAGEIFLLGTTSWRIRRIEAGRMRVEDAGGAAPSVPFWRGEAPARTAELSLEISRLRETATLDTLLSECGLDQSGAEQAIAYLRAGSAALGAMPSQTTVVAERFFDEAGGMQLVLHAPFGARVNRAWGLALRKRFCRTFNFELQAAATDNGLLISLTEQHSFPLELVFHFLKPETVKEVLQQALLASPMFTARWRWNASRALAVMRFSGGRKVPPPIQRMRSDDLLASVFPDQAACAENLVGEIRIPDHPLVRETIDNCLYEAMDLPGLVRVLDAIERGEIRTMSVDTAEPSPFSHEILNSNPFAYLDDAPLEERRARAVELRRTLSPEMAFGPGALDPQAIAQVASEAWPDVRDADELHDALLTLVLLAPVPEWREWFDELRANGRASERRGLWVATERLETALQAEQGNEEAAALVMRGWLESLVPATASELAGRLGLSAEVVESALVHLEARGQVLRGRFRPSAGETEWANRRLLARIHRLTLGRLRNEIEPVAPADLVRFLARWQHLAPGSQLHGVDGTLAIIRQLQGYEVPAAAWEPGVLGKRVARYDPEYLDRLCLSGEVMWGRLSPHPAFERAEAGRRVRPTRVAPLSLFLREDAGWLLPSRRDSDAPLSHAGREVLGALERRGASFFADVVRETKRLASEVEDGLWELVAAGLVTADGFENLRSLVDPRRRRGEGSGRKGRPRHAAGRWALLPRAPADAATDAERFAIQLLDRWGIVFRDLIARETLAPPWREILRVLRRMEDRGEVRGGRLVAGFLGEQFARPEAVEMVRKLRRSDSAEALDIPAADPLNLAGIVLPGARSSALAGAALRLEARVAV